MISVIKVIQYIILFVFIREIQCFFFVICTFSVDADVMCNEEDKEKKLKSCIKNITRIANAVHCHS